MCTSGGTGKMGSECSLLVPLTPVLDPGGYFPRFWWGVRCTSGNSYPISDLIQNLIPYFRPDPNPISFA